MQARHFIFPMSHCYLGAVMVPISWQEMQCPKTKVKEFRKCAKPY